MNKKVGVAVCIAIITTAVVVVSVGGIWLYFWGKGAASNEPLTCYICQAAKNFPKWVPDVDDKFPIPVTNYDECLNDPKHTRECEKGQYCSVLRMKVNEIERVVRKCFKGSRPGCGDVKWTNRLKEKGCFCAADKCKQNPFPDEFWVERTRRFDQSISPGRALSFRKSWRHLLTKNK